MSTHVYCVGCGVENDHAGRFCFACGERLYSPEDRGVTDALGSAPSRDIAVETTAGKSRRLLTIIWASACLISGIAAFVVAASQPTLGGALGTLISGGLAAVTGVALLERSWVASSLSWCFVVVAALGLLVRGFRPVDILGCVVTIAAAIWLTKGLDLPSATKTRRSLLPIASICIAAASVLIIEMR